MYIYIYSRLDFRLKNHFDQSFFSPIIHLSYNLTTKIFRLCKWNERLIRSVI